MKYLTMARPGMTQVPRGQAAGLYQAASEWIEAGLADGRFECVYLFADGGGVAIGNADSHEEVFETLVSYPMYAFFDWEVKPLCEVGRTFAAIQESLSRGGG